MVTAAGEMATVRLQDGTVVRLSPESRLRVRSDIGERTVAIEGKAFFAVAHDESTPFTIHSPGGEVQVLGTRLEVSASETEFEVTVIEGHVAVSSGPDKVVLEAGERASSGTGLKIERSEPNALAWLGSFVAFQATPLSAVAAEMEQRFGMTVLAADSSLLDRTVTAWFADTPPQEVMQAVCRVTAVRCTINQSTTTIWPM
jgi:ferric-dicitrate binding protein FerR (iron transport regulator)